MPLDAVANFVRGNTDELVDNSQTTISVVDASIFPDPSTAGEYNLVIWDADEYPRPDQDIDVEILRVTARDTGADDVTVDRAQEGTTAAEHPTGSALHLSPTAKMFSDIESTFNEFYDSSAQELTADVNSGSVKAGQLSLTPLINEVRSFASGESQDRPLPASLGHRIVATATPLSDPDNDVGFSVEKTWWDDSGDTLRLRVRETESDGGGTAVVTAWSIGTP